MVSGLLQGAAGGASVAIIIKAVDNYSKEFNKATTSMERFKKTAEIVATAAAAAFGAFTVSAVKAGLAMKPIEDSFHKLAKGSDKFLFELDMATKGTISDFELMSNANKALLLGLDQEALPSLFKNAAILGRAAGRTTTEAIQDISLGIGRQSRLILDNLGIIVRAEDAHRKFAESLGITAAELTEEQKNLAFMQEAFAQAEAKGISLGGILENDIVTKIQQLNAEWQNFKTNFGTSFLEVIGPTLVTTEGGFEDLGNTVGRVIGMITGYLAIGMKIVQVGVLGFIEIIATAFTGLVDLVNDIVNLVIKGINKLIDGINVIRSLLGFDKINKLGEVNFTKGIDNFRAGISDMADANYKELQAMTQAFIDTRNGIDKAQNTLDTTSNEVKKEMNIQEQLLATGKTFKYIPETGDVFNQGAFSSSEFQTRAAYEQARLGGGVVVNIDNIYGLDVDEISEALNDKLKSMIAST